MSNLLIVEDELLIAQMYEFKLKQSGHAVTLAHNGEDGLTLAKKIKPELILLDLRMPIMSGSEMLEELRQTEWGSKMRVIILTNISKDEAPASLRQLNVDRYIVKAHYTPSRVVEIVSEVLRLNQSAKQL